VSFQGAGLEVFDTNVKGAVIVVGTFQPANLGQRDGSQRNGAFGTPDGFLPAVDAKYNGAVFLKERIAFKAHAIAAVVDDFSPMPLI
jgi:hypothetical protein